MRSGRLAASALAGALLVAGCTPTTPEPSRSPSPSAAPRPFTVMTTQPPERFDPAAASTAADAIVALNAFSRLMVVHPEGADLKPDLARDCLYTSATTYQCDLPPGLTFHNGHPLTASDVKFSIERAYRLSVPDTSIRLFDSLEKVEIVDDLTVSFVLKYADTQFGYALATPAAAIVDEEIYDPDALRPNEAEVVGSGPYSLVTTASDHLVFERFTDYTGALTGEIDTIKLEFIPDSAAAEQAMSDGTTDVVWRSLTPAALERVSAEMNANNGATTAGFTRAWMPPVRMQRLVFEASSPHREDASVRAAVAAALQGDRSVASVVPPSVAGSVASFPVGGSAEVPSLGGQRLRLTLSYSTRSPGQRDLASLLRDRLEERAGMSVQLVPDAAGADLRLTDEPAWVNTAFGWLQAYVDHALPGSQEKLSDLLHRARETGDADTRQALLAEIQQQAAVDLTLLPHSLGGETLLLGPGTSLQGQPFGPAWQLGLWSLRK
ncbi:MAG: ABC transporter substrate-binding protein [Propioniciclava sp.]|uniref:ABC transporter substrate-binding protein n=1 Tax=Propioniciclava sp. TaxID=2038686 RepID=UPI0039E3187A